MMSHNLTKKPSSFYDIASRKKFVTSDYRIVTKPNGVKYAIARSPSGFMAWKAYEKNKIKKEVIL